MKTSKINSMFNLEDIIKSTNLHRSRVHNIYVYGSLVYKTSDDKSDIDMIIVANNSVENIEINNGKYNCHIITPDKFQNMLFQHHPVAIECIMLPKEFILMEKIDFKFNLQIEKLRHSFSHVSSNSYVKCKKKIAQGDVYIGLKSLFHSIRIPMFGIQLAKFGKIKDFTVANDIYRNIFSKNWTYEKLDETFRPIRNEVMSEFRSVTVK